MKWYKTIDFYITWKYLGTFFYAIALILSIAIVFDISENLDEFLSKEIPTKDIIVDYYLNFHPLLCQPFQPVVYVYCGYLFYLKNGVQHRNHCHSQQRCFLFALYAPLPGFGTDYRNLFLFTGQFYYSARQ